MLAPAVVMTETLALRIFVAQVQFANITTLMETLATTEMSALSVILA